jgi:hypothetical protein
LDFQRKNENGVDSPVVSGTITCAMRLNVIDSFSQPICIVFIPCLVKKLEKTDGVGKLDECRLRAL